MDVDWNDWRAFLAVARSGSTLAAGRNLRVSQTTAARRIAALEEALGVTLFERRQAGYSLTDAGHKLLPQVEAIEAAATSAEQIAYARSREISGAVRLTTEEIFAVTLLTPLLRELREAYPGVRIELETSDEVQDLAAGHADIALRSTMSPEGGGLVGRRLADENWTFYASRSYAAERPLPRRVSELRDHPLIGGGGERVWRVYGPWLEQRGLGEAVAFHHSSATGLLSAVRAGVGLAALPCLVADREPDLVRCFPPSGKGRGLWLLTHERFRHEPRVRVVLDFLADRLGKLFRSPAPQMDNPHPNPVARV